MLITETYNEDCNVIINKDIKVGTLAAEDVRIRAVFEKIGIDYCCNGHVCLGDAIAGNSLTVHEVVELIEKALKTTAERTKIQNPDDYSNAELIDYIIDRHHSYLKENLPLIAEKFIKVLNAHEEKHGDELKFLDKRFNILCEELKAHLNKEEVDFFPQIKAVKANEKYSEEIIALVEQLKNEHNAAGNEFQLMRDISNDFTPPVDACLTFAALYDDLAALEKDIHEHIHLENNILFVRILENKN